VLNKLLTAGDRGSTGRSEKADKACSEGGDQGS
jgi:hypothetical protein